MNYLILTNAPTFYENKKFSAYAPYVNEMDIWFSNVEKIGVLSPNYYPDAVFRKEFKRQDILHFKIPFQQFKNLTTLLKAVFLFPYVLIVFIKAFMWADHIHLRCPGNIGLIGCVVQIFFPKKPKTVKYAGNWDPNAKQPWSYNLQKRILSNTSLSKNIKILVYGDWEDQSKNIVPFFTASFSENERYSIEKEFSSPFKFIFVGSLNDGKRPIFTIKIIEQLLLNKIPVTLEMYGEGFLNQELSEYIKINNLEPFVKLMGNQKLEVLKNVYKSSHFLILASKSEGWPKAIAEAMFFGCIPISTSISCVPWMLGSPPAPEGGAKNVTITKRGILIPESQNSKDEGVDNPYFIEKTAEILIKLIKNTEELTRMSLEAQEWSQQYTLEKFEHEIKKLLNPVEKSSKKSSSLFGRGEAEQ